jgi:hypothetical protein
LLEAARLHKIGRLQKTYAAPSTIAVYQLLPGQQSFANAFQTGIAITQATARIPYKTI